MSLQVVGPREKAVTVTILDTAITPGPVISDSFDVGPYAAGTIQVIVTGTVTGLALTLEHSNDSDPTSFTQIPKFDGTLSGTIAANLMVPVSGARYCRANMTAGTGGRVRVIGNFSLQN